MLKDFLKSLPYLKRLHGEIGDLKAEVRRWRTWSPPGHFYSPIPSLAAVADDAARIFPAPPSSIPAIDLGAERQLELLGKLEAYYSELPRAWQSPGSARYHYENEYYSYADGISLYLLLRHLRPQKLIEVGSGFSSAVVLDTIDTGKIGAPACTFIEPYPERLLTLITSDDRKRTTLLESRVQDVPIYVFQSLGANDILLIDSSHVSKTGSDLNYLLFDVLPNLQAGVWVHFHDVFYPFEYPRAWVEAGVAWNEAYLLRAFLQFNQAFSIEFFTSYLLQRHRAVLEQSFPLVLNSEKEQLSMQDAPGSSLWLRKLA